MKRTSRLLVVLGVVALSAGIAGPLSAHAADGDNDVVEFQGQISTAPTLIPLVGEPVGGIAYNYAGNACDIVSLDTLAGGEFGQCNLVQPAAGLYHSTVCGTGEAFGAANLTELVDGTVDGPINYGITLVAGLGVINGDVTGVAVLVPSPAQGLGGLGTCGDTFIIEGVARA